MSDHKTTIQELRDIRHKFITERGWESYGSPRNIATSIIIEAAELLEHYQWGEEADKDEVAKELGDIIAYCLDMAHALDIDLTTTYKEKQKAAEQKFPLEKFGTGTFNKQEYNKIKSDYRAGKK